MSVWIAVLLSALLGPGMGQLYNRDYKKAVWLIVVSLIVFLAAMQWLRGVLTPFIPLDLATADPLALKPMIENGIHEVMKTKGHIFYAYQVLLLGLWLYSVIDAYRVAKKQKSIPQGGTLA